MMNLNVVTDASYFAIGAHRKQKRKDGAPYELHLAAVADWCRWAGLGQEVVAAAWLHDVLEDTDWTYDDLVIYFGERVAHLVLEVTDAAKPEDGNRAVRVAINREHLAHASPEGMSIKLADLIDNTTTIVAVDPNFARVYLREKEELLPHLHLGHAGLYDKACDVLNEALEKLGMNNRN
jgi:(p)ppGpp synthase/HD superfamily hydrolase